MRRLRPILLRILAAGLIGAVVTVGVAVGCAMSATNPPMPFPEWKFWSDKKTTLSVSWAPWGRRWGTALFGVSSVQRGWFARPNDAPLENHLPFPMVAVPPPDAIGFRKVRLAGWPCMCVWGAIDWRPPAPHSAQSNALTGSPTLTAIDAVSVGRPLHYGDVRGIGGYLPIAPIWSGLAINTLFYAAFAWVLLFLPGTLRRWRRGRRGRCMKCGYDRAGLAMGAACPECGAGLVRSSPV